MSMDDFKALKLFALLCESSQEISSGEMESAYEDFLVHVEIFNQSEQDLSTAFRILNLTRIEFDSLGSLPFYEQGEKCA